MKKLILFITFICITTTSNAQIYEIGILGGGSNYIGDIGSEYYINPNNLMGSIIFKWNVNPRIALRGTFTYSQLTADDANATNDARKLRNLKFTNNIKELAVGIEYNYFSYNVDRASQAQTPYLLLQVAAFNYKVVTGGVPNNYEYGSKTSLAIPFGIGYKTRIVYNFAMAVELRSTYTFTDQIDYNNKDISSLTFGNPNNNDWYTFVGVSFVYTFGRPPCYAPRY